MTTATQKSTVLSRCRASGLLGIIVFIFSFALTPSAQAQCPEETFEAAIEVAGAGEKRAYDLLDEISSLPLPPPRLGQFQQIANQFADVSMGIVRVRTHVFRGNWAAAEAQIDVLMRHTSQIERAISKVSSLPVPLPEPGIEGLNIINGKLMEQVSSLPVPLPDPEEIE